MICMCFLLFCELLFHFLDNVLWSLTVFNFDEVQFICFSFVACALYLINHCLTQVQVDLPLCFNLRVVQFLLHLGLWSNLICIWCEVGGSTSFFYIWIPSSPRNIYWKDYSCPHWLVKNTSLREFLNGINDIICLVRYKAGTWNMLAHIFSCQALWWKDINNKQDDLVDKTEMTTDKLQNITWSMTHWKLDLGKVEEDITEKHSIWRGHAMQSHRAME